MVKKYERQDQYGNVIYNYSSSDIIIDLDTGHTVKQDIDTILASLGLAGSAGSSGNLSIDAATLEGMHAADFVSSTTYQNAIDTLTQNLANKADTESPTFTGTPTVPNVDAKDGTQKIANTLYVDNTAVALKNEITETLKTYAKAIHQHSASDITDGTFASLGVMAMNGTDYTTSRVRNIAFLASSQEVPATLPSGTLLAVYDES